MLHFLHLHLRIKNIQRRFPTLNATLDAALMASKMHMLAALTALPMNAARLLLIDTRLFTFQFSRELKRKEAPN